MFSNGAKVYERPENITLISGDIDALNNAKAAGMNTLSSPKLRRLYMEKYAQYAKEMEEYNQLSGVAKELAKTPTRPVSKRDWLDYATEVQRLQSQRGNPWLKDFRLLENKTGLSSGVAPLNERENAVKALNEMTSLYEMPIGILDDIDLSSFSYTYPNGRVVNDFTKAAKELELINKAKYNNVFYDPATYAEFNWKEANGIK